jgi:hypothetical protein
MHRPLLVSLMVLGLVTTIIGGFGVFAAFSDRATTGTNSITSLERAAAADLKIATPALGPEDCATATYTDDLTTGLFSVSDFEPGVNRAEFFCLRNVGTESLSLLALVIDLAETDVDCTGDEAAAGDTTCGAGGAGELGAILEVSFANIPNCDSSNLGFGSSGPLLGTSPVTAMGNIAAGTTFCGAIRIRASGTATVEDLIKAQTDRVTWRFAFEGTT